MTADDKDQIEPVEVRELLAIASCLMTNCSFVTFQHDCRRLRTMMRMIQTRRTRPVTPVKEVRCHAIAVLDLKHLKGNAFKLYQHVMECSLSGSITGTKTSSTLVYCDNTVSAPWVGPEPEWLQILIFYCRYRVWKGPTEPIGKEGAQGYAEARNEAHPGCGKGHDQEVQKRAIILWMLFQPA